MSHLGRGGEKRGEERMNRPRDILMANPCFIASAK
jgi:hypothetical protein